MSTPLDRRGFLLGLSCCILCACAKKPEEPSVDPEKAFNDWLRKKRRYRQFSTLDEAKKAYNSEISQKDKEAEWKAYRKKHNIH